MIAFLVLIVLGVIVAIVGLPTKTNETWLTALIRRWAYPDLDPALVYGVVMTESRGQPNAENPADPSVGLMGVTPLIGRAYAGLTGTDEEVLQALHAPEVNMGAGTRFLRHLQTKYGPALDSAVWVSAYNDGEPRFDAGRRDGPYISSVALFRGQWKG